MLAWSASFMFSLITTARLNDIDPKPGLPTSSPASPTSLRTASANSCRGTGCKTSQRFRPPERGPHRMGTVLQGTGTEVERSEEHTSELKSLMSISYAVFGLKKN